MERLKFREHPLVILTIMLFPLYFYMCSSLNDEGLALLRLRERVVSDPFGALSNWIDDVGVNDPCLWFGVECSDGNVVALNLKNLCLGGTLAPELGDLVHVQSIILRNNSFNGFIPKEIGKLKELEELDLGFNNFSGPLPCDLGNNLSLTILLLDNNDHLGSICPERNELVRISEVQVDESQLSNTANTPSFSQKSISWNIGQIANAARRLFQAVPSVSPKREAPSPSPSPSTSPSPSPSTSPSYVPNISTPSAASSNSNHLALVLSIAIGGPVLLLFTVVGILFCKGGKVASVRPWATGLSGQLQKAFVTGVPKLRRSELETACEDFSNVISSSLTGTVYKGTLSNGVEIAVASVAVATAKDWSNNLEAQFRNKIDTLSKVNHKNFVNLLGYCEEDQPFTRMLVFEYAPNGTLFDHLHIKESEHLDWGMRMRIIMGMAYCLEHMHQLSPSSCHKNLTSTVVHLTEDYAAKVSDFGFWSEIAAVEMETNPESNIYNFGVILFEIITGRLPYSDGGPLEDWASDYLRGGRQPLSKMVDPTLQSFQAEQLEQIGEVIRSCVYPDPTQRPGMRAVTTRLREITDIRPDGAIPKLSPLWWAELEILSTEAS